VLTVRPVFVADGVSLAEVACRHEQGRGEVDPAPARMLVLVALGYASTVHAGQGTPSGAWPPGRSQGSLLRRSTAPTGCFRG
jgi:hypothetical protein